MSLFARALALGSRDTTAIPTYMEVNLHRIVQRHALELSYVSVGARSRILDLPLSHDWLFPRKDARETLRQFHASGEGFVAALHHESASRRLPRTRGGRSARGSKPRPLPRPRLRRPLSRLVWLHPRHRLLSRRPFAVAAVASGGDYYNSSHPLPPTLPTASLSPPLPYSLPSRFSLLASPLTPVQPPPVGARLRQFKGRWATLLLHDFGFRT